MQELKEYFDAFKSQYHHISSQKVAADSVCSGGQVVKTGASRLIAIIHDCSIVFSV